ncbi:interleukin-10 receptor subunit alpha [Discoglossus pictus]
MLMYLAVISCLLSQGKGDVLAAPKDVHFKLQFFPCILQWSPGEPSAQDVMYEVEYHRYGGDSWQTVPRCSPTSILSCDLTPEILPQWEYIGRVRSVRGNYTSLWQRTSHFSLQDAMLPAPTVKLTLDGLLLNVDLQYPEIKISNWTLRYMDNFPHHNLYTVYVRRTTDNHTFIQKETNLTFKISELDEGLEYCVSVLPTVTSRPNIGILSAESCTKMPTAEPALLLIIASCILGFVFLLIFINIFICLYIRGNVRTPQALKSLIKRSWSWTDKSVTAVPECEDSVCWETEVIAQLLVEPRTSLLRSSADSGFGSQILTEKCLHPPSSSVDNAKGDSGINILKTDPGLCERTPDEVLPIRRQHPQIKGEDSGISLSTGSPCLKRICSLGGIPYREDLKDSEDIVRSGIVEEAQWGYLKQSGSKGEQTEQAKDYLTQGSRSHIEPAPQDNCKNFEEPWAQITESFHTSIPLTAVFSPFSRVLLDFGVSSPCLGSVELTDSRC